MVLSASPSIVKRECSSFSTNSSDSVCFDWIIVFVSSLNRWGNFFSRSVSVFSYSCASSLPIRSIFSCILPLFSDLSSASVCHGRSIIRQYVMHTVSSLARLCHTFIFLLLSFILVHNGHVLGAT